jgi:hypothetical protein
MIVVAACCLTIARIASEAEGPVVSAQTVDAGLKWLRRNGWGFYVDGYRPRQQHHYPVAMMDSIQTLDARIDLDGPRCSIRAFERDGSIAVIDFGDRGRELDRI